MDDPFDFGSKKSKAEGELEVTGVSRSGRVRKKSSKLTDFENLDELEMRTPKAKKDKDKERQPEYSTPAPRSVVKKDKVLYSNEDILSDEDDSGGFAVRPEEIFLKEANISDFNFESDFPYGNVGSSGESVSGGVIGDIGDFDDSEIYHESNDEGLQPIFAELPSQSQSVYLTEKSNKKKLVVKDNTVMGKMRAHRKDKGIWKRRTKRMAAEKSLEQNTSQSLPQQSAQEGKKIKSPTTRKYINKPSLSASTSHSSPSTSQATSITDTTKGGRSSAASESTSAIPSISGVFKPVQTSPLDVAAHLKLLGESLTIVGERLKEHEGQIAVSGSISVLLDSLVCALGPLMCLTQQVPEMNVIPQERLSQIMDNIAYIMPGL